MLEVKDIEKAFGGIRAVDGCSLKVDRNTITGLIGPNGAGKTTLFNLITGFLKPDGGKVFFEGDRVDGMTPYNIFRKGLYRTFQISRELEQMTVLENLMLIPEGQPGEKAWNCWFRFDRVKEHERKVKERALEVLEFVELMEVKNEYAQNLSGGQKRLLELARSMMADPRMVLLDEPGAGINPTLMKKLTEDIAKIKRETETTFFLIEHDMDLVMNLCDPVIVMNAGKKLMEGSPEKVQKNEDVIDAYLGA